MQELLCISVWKKREEQRIFVLYSHCLILQRFLIKLLPFFPFIFFICIFSFIYLFNLQKQSGLLENDPPSSGELCMWCSATELALCQLNLWCPGAPTVLPFLAFGPLCFISLAFNQEMVDRLEQAPCVASNPCFVPSLLFVASCG